MECLDVNFVYSLIFHQSSDALQILVLEFIFFIYFVALKSALICANIYLLPAVNCETRSACKAAVNRVLLLSWDTISPVYVHSASHSMRKYAK